MSRSTRVTEELIDDGAISTRTLEDGSVTEGKLGAGAVTAGKLGTGAVTAGKLGTGAATADKIGAGAVTADKLGTGAVTANKLGDGAVTTGKLGDGAVTTGKLDDGAVDESKLGELAVTESKIGAGAVTTAKIDDNAVTIDKIGFDPLLEGAMSVWIPARAFTPSVIQGAVMVDKDFASASKASLSVLTFPKPQQTYASTVVAWPKSWDRGTVSFQVYWFSPSATGGVAWSIGFLDLDSGQTLNQTITLSGLSISTASSANFLYAATPMSLGINASGEGSVSVFHLSRSVGNGSDTLSGDAMLIGVMMKYLNSAGNDD